MLHKPYIQLHLLPILSYFLFHNHQFFPVCCKGLAFMIRGGFPCRLSSPSDHKRMDLLPNLLLTASIAYKSAKNLSWQRDAAFL